MFRRRFSILFAIVFLAVFDAHAYFFSATDGPNLFLFKAEAGSGGNLAVLSEFKYASPGAMGSTALLPAPGSTDTRKLFDLFGVYSLAGKPVVFRDRIEFDESSGVFRLLSRKTFKKHKLDSYNTVSSAGLQALAAEITANDRFLLTQNGTDVNLRKVTGAGKLTGKNKPTFKGNPPSFQPLSAAVSPDGAFAVQSFFERTSVSGSAANATVRRGLTIKDVVNNLIANFVVTGDIFSLTVAAELAVCAAFVEFQDDLTAGASAIAAKKTGVFYFPIDKLTLRPGKVVTISKVKATTLSQYQIFNTALLLPDGKGIVFSKEKSGKLEFLHQPLNGGCGPKQGRPKTFLSRTNPTIQNNNPLYGFAAAACAAGLLNGFC